MRHHGWWHQPWPSSTSWLPLPPPLCQEDIHWQYVLWLQLPALTLDQWQIATQLSGSSWSLFGGFCQHTYMIFDLCCTSCVACLWHGQFYPFHPSLGSGDGVAQSDHQSLEPSLSQMAPRWWGKRWSPSGLSGKARCFRIAWWPSASFKRTICNWTLLGTWAFKPNGGGRSCKSFFSMASLYSRPSSWKSMADWYPVTTSKMWTVGLADVSRSSRGNDNQSKLPRGRSGVTMGEVWRMESPSVICFRSSKVKFSASTAMMVSEEQMNAMREYSCLKPIYQTVLLLPDIFTSSCQTVLLFWILGHWIMFHVQPFHIFAFYFVLCCGLVDFLKSSVFCENYTGAQGPPL